MIFATIANPGGIAPKLLPELLPDNQAQVAQNLVMWSGGAASIGAPEDVFQLPTGTPIKTIYKFGNSEQDDEYWFGFTTPTNVARGPIAGDAEQTTYFTGTSGLRKTRLALAITGGPPYPAASYPVAVPPPLSPMTIDETVVPDESSLIRPVLSMDKVYIRNNDTFPHVVTFKVYKGTTDETSLWTVTYTATNCTHSANPSKTTVTLTGYTTVGPCDVHFTATRAGFPTQYASFGLRVGSHVPDNRDYQVTASVPIVHRNLAGVYSSPTITFSSKQCTVSGGVKSCLSYAARMRISYANAYGVYSVGHDVTENQTSVAYTIPEGATAVRCDLYFPQSSGVATDLSKLWTSTTVPISYYAEETSTPEERAYVYTNVTAWGEESSPSPPTLYSKSAGGTTVLSGFDGSPGAEYNVTLRRIYRTASSASGVDYFFVAEIPIDETTYTDSVESNALGEVLPSVNWDAPPTDLHGLIALPSGAMCGISGKDICFSSIGLPYAWPQKYRKTVDYDPVAVAPLGQGVVVLTNGFPYFINSGDPETSSMTKLDSEQACISARSVVSLEGAVAYASPDGLVMISASGTQVVTGSLFSRADWQALNPKTMFADLYEQRYYAFFEGGGGFIFDPSGPTFVMHDVDATACYSDPVTDTFYIADPVSYKVRKWDAGAALNGVWKSKIFQTPKPVTPSVAKVRAKSYEDLTFKLWADGVLKHTQVVTSDKIFRLPSGYKATRFEIELSGTDTWYTVAVADSVEDLKRV